MKKDRNAFFESSQITSSFTQPPMPQMNMNFNQQQMMQQQMPYQAASNSSSFYSGPLNTFPTASIDTTDYDTKLSRLERQIQKLESRVSKLENATMSNSSSDDVNITSNMYML